MKDKKSKLYEGIIEDTKNRLINDINKLVEANLIPEDMDVIELPRRLILKENQYDSNLSDTIMAVQKDAVIVNSMFDGGVIPLQKLGLNALLAVYKQLENIQE